MKLIIFWNSSYKEKFFPYPSGNTKVCHTLRYDSCFYNYSIIHFQRDAVATPYRENFY